MFVIVMCDCDVTCDMSPFSYIIGVNVQVRASRDAARDVRGVASKASSPRGSPTPANSSPLLLQGCLVQVEDLAGQSVKE